MRIFKIYGPSWMGFFERRVPYPLRAARITVSFILFPWIKPSFNYNKEMPEQARRGGDTIWYARWLWVQIAYSRWS